MSKKLFIIGILIILAIAGYFIYGAFATSNPHSWTDGLVGYWSFDGQYTTSTDGTKDVSGNGNYGSFGGGTAAYKPKPTAGVVGQALSFDGVDDYVDMGDVATLEIGTGDLTAIAWIKTNMSGSYGRVICKERTADYASWGYGVRNTGVIYAHLNNDAGTKRPSTDDGVLINDGQWHMIAVVFDRDGYMTRFSDGIQTGTQDDITALSGTDIIASGQRALIGARWNNGTPGVFFNGLIDEVRIYNRALSADEVKQHYEQTRRNLVINTPSGTPPVGWWKLDENPAIHGSTIRDYSANANTGTLSTGDGATNKSADGQVGKALSFDGVDDYVDIPTSAPLNITSVISVSYWVKTNTIAKEWQSTASKRSGSANSWQRYLNYGKPTFTIWQSNNVSKNTVTDNAVNVGVWYFVTGVADGSNVRLYVNGALAGTPTAYDGTIKSSDGNVWLGKTIFAGREFNGSLDEVRIYDYARTADQIAADYRAGAYRTTLNTSVPSNWWTDGLVGYWSFDGQYTTTTSGASAGTRDTSGNNNWGTFSGGVGVAGGISGQALKFDGVNDYVGLGNVLDFERTSPFSISAWVKRASSNTNDVIAAKTLSSGTYRGWMLWLHPTRNLDFVLRNDQGTTNLIEVGSNSAYTDTTVWYHIVATYDGSSSASGVKLYVNGQAVATTIVTDGLSATTITTANANIGARNDGNSPFDGLIDEVRIYNRALSADEVKQHYEQTGRNLGI